MTESKRTYQSVIYVSSGMLTLQPASPRQPKQKTSRFCEPQTGESSPSEFSPDVIQRIIKRLKEK